MAITSITIENFKGIGDAVTIPIRPITLLFGKNSSGKSTVLQALHYINKYIQHLYKNSYNVGEPEPAYVDPGIDLGTFHSLVHRHEPCRNIRIRIELDISSWVEMRKSEERWFEFSSSESPNGYSNYSMPPWEAIYSLLEIRYLGPLRELPPRYYNPQMAPDESLWTKGLEAWNTLARNPKLIEKVNHYMRDVLKLGYSFLPLYRISLDKDGEIVTNLRKICSSENIEVDKLKEQVLVPLEQLPHYNGEILLRDENRNIEVSLSDIGFGISQVVPVLVGALEVPSSSRGFGQGQPGKFFAVEQPELHLHPAAQVALGDVFIDAIKNRNRTMLIETHSEHLLLRIMRRMRETFEDRIEEGRFPVTPDDVVVLFFESHNSRTIIREMPINERGDLVKAWPGGFFEEDIEEVLA